LAIPLALVGSFINYWAYKYMLLRKHKMPEMFSDMMATFFANFMPLILIVWGLSFCIFVDKIQKAYYKDFSGYLDEDISENDGFT
jgi:hypothetical protein